MANQNNDMCIFGNGSGMLLNNNGGYDGSQLRDIQEHPLCPALSKARQCLLSGDDRHLLKYRHPLIINIGKKRNRRITNSSREGNVKCLKTV